MLQDRLVGGMNNFNTCMHQRLLQEKLDLTNAIEIALGMEAVDKNERRLEAATGTSPGTSTQNQRPALKTPTRDKTSCIQCHHCRKTNHKAANCRSKSAKCYNCGHMGHIKAVCCSKTRITEQRHPV